jgi:hypothetical protein
MLRWGLASAATATTRARRRGLARRASSTCWPTSASGRWRTTPSGPRVIQRFGLPTGRSRRRRGRDRGRVRARGRLLVDRSRRRDLGRPDAPGVASRSPARPLAARRDLRVGEPGCSTWPGRRYPPASAGGSSRGRTPSPDRARPRAELGDVLPRRPTGVAVAALRERHGVGAPSPPAGRNPRRRRRSPPPASGSGPVDVREGQHQAEAVGQRQALVVRVPGVDVVVERVGRSRKRSRTRWRRFEVATTSERGGSPRRPPSSSERSGRSPRSPSSKARSSSTSSVGYGQGPAPPGARQRRPGRPRPRPGAGPRPRSAPAGRAPPSTCRCRAGRRAAWRGRAAGHEGRRRWRAGGPGRRPRRPADRRRRARAARHAPVPGDGRVARERSGAAPAGVRHERVDHGGDVAGAQAGGHAARAGSDVGRRGGPATAAPRPGRWPRPPPAPPGRRRPAGRARRRARRPGPPAASRAQALRRRARVGERVRQVAAGQAGRLPGGG